MAIQIIGNVGTQGYALPMVSAYPTDVNSQYLLAWNPTQQALDYIPYVGNALGDFTVTRDLSVTRNAVVTGNLTTNGNLLANTFGTASGPTISVLNAISSVSTINATGYQVSATAVVGTRKTGWGAPTGTATRTTFVTSTVTLPLLAERVKALIDDLTTHGLIGT